MSRYDPDYFVMIVSERHKDLLREAEQWRFLKAVQPQRPSRRWTSTFRAMASRPGEWISRLRCLAQGSLATITGGC